MRLSLVGSMMAAGSRDQMMTNSPSTTRTARDRPRTSRPPRIETVVVLDLETNADTSEDAREHEIIEVGACRVVNGSVSERFASLVLNSRPLSPSIVELTGIEANDDLEAQRPTRAGSAFGPTGVCSVRTRWLRTDGFSYDFVVLDAACTRLGLPSDPQASASISSSWRTSPSHALARRRCRTSTGLGRLRTDHSTRSLRWAREVEHVGPGSPAHWDERGETTVRRRPSPVDVRQRLLASAWEGDVRQLEEIEAEASRVAGQAEQRTSGVEDDERVAGRAVRDRRVRTRQTPVTESGSTTRRVGRCTSSSWYASSGDSTIEGESGRLLRTSEANLSETDPFSTRQAPTSMISCSRAFSDVSAFVSRSRTTTVSILGGLEVRAGPAPFSSSKVSSSSSGRATQRPSSSRLAKGARPSSRSSHGVPRAAAMGKIAERLGQSRQPTTALPEATTSRRPRGFRPC